MVHGVINLVLGALMVAAGASGRFAILGTDRPIFLIGLGIGTVAIGGYQILRSRR